MKAYVFLGGDVNLDRQSINIQKGDLVIAADSGYDNACKLGLEDTVQIVVGDLDSVKVQVLPENLKVIRVPAEKSESDAQLAVNILLEEHVTDVEFIGGLGGRLDHTLANLHLIESLEKSGVHASIRDGYNRVRYVYNTFAVIVKGKYKYFGVVPVNDVVEHVNIEGAKYNLSDATINRTEPSFAISNEAVDKCATVSCKGSAMFLIESN